MKEFGPPSSFNTERYNKLLSTVHQYYSCRCEAFNSKMRNYNVYSNKAASSRDIALSFAVLEDIRLVCDGERHSVLAGSCWLATVITFYSTILYHFMPCTCIYSDRTPPLSRVTSMHITIQERWVRTGTHVPFKCGPKVSEWSNTTQTQGDIPARSTQNGNYHIFMLSRRKHTK